MKAMVIGLRPEYLYPGKLSEWKKNNTYYAANMGASLISNAIVRQFSADYVDDFSDVSGLKNKYDVCILALATHIHPNRDVSMYADFVEQLDIKTIVISAGIQDYDEKISLDYKIHPSMKRILHKASEDSQWIGVRGHYTASVLRSNGFKKVVPIGCPSMYWTLDGDIFIEKPEKFSKPLIVYHRTIALNSYNLIRSYPLLGQDYQDQPVFTNTLRDDAELMRYITKEYSVKGELFRDKIFDTINANGSFFFSFKEWFYFIGQHDFVLGSRLHGTIAALIQRIPAILVVRDLRTREMAEFYHLPSASWDDLNRNSIDDIYHQANFSKFNEFYELRYKNYVKLLDENGLKHNLVQTEKTDDYTFTFDDLNSNINITYSLLSNLKSEMELIKEKQLSLRVRMLSNKLRGYAGRMYRLIRRSLKRTIGRKQKTSHA